MKKNRLTELSDEDLIKKRDYLKKVLIGSVVAYSAIMLVGFGVMIYALSADKGDKISIGLFLPFIIPLLFVPAILGGYSKLHKEIKSRNLK